MNYSTLLLSVFGYFFLLFALVWSYRKYTVLLSNLADIQSRDIFLRDVGLVSKAKFSNSLTETSLDVTDGSLAVLAIRLIDSSTGEVAKLDDALLSEVVMRIRHAIRSTDIIYQESNSDFIVMFSRYSSHSGAKTVAQRIIGLFDDSLVDGEGVKRTFSCYVGVDTPSILALKEREDGVESLVDNAITAVTQAMSRTVQVSVHSDSPNRYASTLSVQDIQVSFHAGHFSLAFQPQLDIIRNRATGVEVLLRYMHPIHGYTAPADFIPLMERSKMIIPIGEWVLREACKTFISWGREDITLAVNVSSIQFAEDDFVDVVMQICQETGMKPELLKLELTETTAISNVEKAKVKFNQLLRFGVKVVIDDFGKGYSSLMYLKAFPIDALKIDSAFVWDIGKNEYGERIIKALVTLANDLGYQTIAEGVETLNQVDFLEKLGVNCLQGYFVSRPLSSTDFIANLDSHGYSRTYTTIA